MPELYKTDLKPKAIKNQIGLENNWKSQQTVNKKEVQN